MSPQDQDWSPDPPAGLASSGHPWALPSCGTGPLCPSTWGPPPGSYPQLCRHHSCTQLSQAQPLTWAARPRTMMRGRVWMQATGSWVWGGALDMREWGVGWQALPQLLRGRGRPGHTVPTWAPLGPLGMDSRTLQHCRLLAWGRGGRVRVTVGEVPGFCRARQPAVTS